jgi:hypothetical protein
VGVGDDDDQGVGDDEANDNNDEGGNMSEDEYPLLEELLIVEDLAKEHEAIEEYVVEEIDEEQEPDTPEPEPEPKPPKKPGLDGKYWTGYCLSVIKGYGNLEATLSTPQYGFRKGLIICGESGYDATVKELDENLIGRDVIQMLEPKSVTYDMF